MSDTYLSRLFEQVKKNFEIEHSCKAFCNFSVKFIELHKSLYTLIRNIDEIKNSLSNPLLLDEIESIRRDIEANTQKILEIISETIERKVIVHIVSNNDTLWRVSKLYNSDMREICELNCIKNVFSLKENKIILIPLKIL